MKNTPNEKFVHPRLPFVWLVTTFAAPSLVLILPELFKDESVAWPVRIAVALGLLSVMLLASCIVLLLKFYELSYEVQVIEFKYDFHEMHLHPQAMPQTQALSKE